MLSVGVSFPQVQEYWSPQLTHLQRKQRQTGTKRKGDRERDRCKELGKENRIRKIKKEKS